MSIDSYGKNLICHYGHTLSPRSWFEQNWICTIWGCFHTSFGFSDRFVSEKNFSNCFYVNICHPNAIVAPLYTLWLWCKQTWTIFYAATQVSAWRSSSEKMYQNVSSPWKKVWPFILTCLNFLCKIIVCARSCWNLV